MCSARLVAGGGVLSNEGWCCPGGLCCRCMRAVNIVFVYCIVPVSVYFLDSSCQTVRGCKDEGCVDPDKVEKILGISEQQAPAYVDTDDTSTDALGKII